MHTGRFFTALRQHTPPVHLFSKVNALLNSMTNISDILAIDQRSYQGGQRIVCRATWPSEYGHGVSMAKAAGRAWDLVLFQAELPKALASGGRGTPGQVGFALCFLVGL